MIELETVAGRMAPVARVTSSGQAAMLLGATAGGGSVEVKDRGGEALLRRHRFAARRPLGNLGVRVSTVDLPADGGGNHGELVAPTLVRMSLRS